MLITTLAVVSTIGAVRLGRALGDSERANAEGNASLWESLLAQAQASRMTGHAKSPSLRRVRPSVLS